MSSNDNEKSGSLAGLGSSPRVAEAYKELIRYIHSHNLGSGSHLPPQEELRQELGYSHHTLSRAMGLLTEAGVVTRKPKVGTTIQDPEATMKGIWTIGLLPQATEVLDVPFFAYLVHLLQSQLVRLGCKVHLFPNAEGNSAEQMGHFPGLEEEIEAGRLDGIVSTVHLRSSEVRQVQRRGLTLIHVGPDTSAENAVCINQRSMVAKATEHLLEQGCHHVGIVSNYGSEPGQAGFQDACDGWDGREVKGESLHKGNGPEAGAKVCEELYERPMDARPDALIILDDRIAMGLTAELSRQEGYRPHIAVQANLQVPLSFPVPVVRYNVDIEKMAHLGAQKLMRQLRDPAEPRGITWVEPEMASSETDGGKMHAGTFDRDEVVKTS